MGTSETGSALSDVAGTAEEAPGAPPSTVCGKFNTAREKKMKKSKGHYAGFASLRHRLLTLKPVLMLSAVLCSVCMELRRRAGQHPGRLQ